MLVLQQTGKHTWLNGDRLSIARIRMIAKPLSKAQVRQEVPLHLERL